MSILALPATSSKRAAAIQPRGMKVWDSIDGIIMDSIFGPFNEHQKYVKFVIFPK